MASNNCRHSNETGRYVTYQIANAYLKNSYVHSNHWFGKIYKIMRNMLEQNGAANLTWQVAVWRNA